MKYFTRFVIMLLLIFSSINTTSAHYDINGKTWDTSSSKNVYYYIDTNEVPSSFVTPITNATNQWSNSLSGLVLGRSFSSSSPLYVGYRYNSADFPNDEIGVTWITYSSSTGKIYDVELLFNSTKSWSTNGTDDYDVLTVALHEFGHSIGLDHVGGWYSTSDTKNHSMFSYYNKVKQILHSHDIEGGNSLY